MDGIPEGGRLPGLTTSPDAQPALPTESVLPRESALPRELALDLPQDPARGSLPFSRKYLGSKRLLRDRIASRMLEVAGPPATFLDGFCGTGAVAFAMAERPGRGGPARITAVDLLRSNCVVLRGCASVGLTAASSVPRIIEMLNQLSPRQGYISEHFADTYFTAENCGRMDATREEIEVMRQAGRIGEAEHDILLASFLLAADRVANTLGQYDAFLKNIAGRSMVEGRHLVDERVRSPFALHPLEPFPGPGLTVREGDMLELLAGIDVDVAYFDPPYNHRQYCDNYHLLENLARWEKPPLAGKTRKFDRSALKSPFSTKSGAESAMRRLVDGARARHLFISYSSEGIVSKDMILSILSARGTATVEEIPYPVFGNGAGVSARRMVTEYLFHVADGR